MEVRKLEEIHDLRTVWPNESRDFTPWLAQADNIAILSEAIGIDITVDETESSVGNFNVDIFAYENDTKNRVQLSYIISRIDETTKSNRSSDKFYEKMNEGLSMIFPYYEHVIASYGSER